VPIITTIICGVLAFGVLAAWIFVVHVMTGPHDLPDRETHPVVLAALLWRDQLVERQKRRKNDSLG
jgi:hypothetical protein